MPWEPVLFPSKQEGKRGRGVPGSGVFFHFPCIPDPNLNPCSESCQPGCSRADIAAGTFPAAFSQICLLLGHLKRTLSSLCRCAVRSMPCSKAMGVPGDGERGGEGLRSGAGMGPGAKARMRGGQGWVLLPLLGGGLHEGTRHSFCCRAQLGMRAACSGGCCRELLRARERE